MLHVSNMGHLTKTTRITVTEERVHHVQLNWTKTDSSTVTTQMKHSESMVKNAMKSKVKEMFSMSQKAIKKKPSNHWQYLKTRFLGTTESISRNHLTRNVDRSFITRSPNIKLSKALPAPAIPPYSWTYGVRDNADVLSTTSRSAPKGISPQFLYFIFHWQHHPRDGMHSSHRIQYKSLFYVLLSWSSLGKLQSLKSRWSNPV